MCCYGFINQGSLFLGGGGGGLTCKDKRLWHTQQMVLCILFALCSSIPNIMFTLQTSFKPLLLKGGGQERGGIDLLYCFSAPVI
jgi:hypothetical protein